jgi:hypothetical protein
VLCECCICRYWGFKRGVKSSKTILRSMTDSSCNVGERILYTCIQICRYFRLTFRRGLKSPERNYVAEGMYACMQIWRYSRRCFEDEELDIFWGMKTCLACKFAGTRGLED